MVAWQGGDLRIDGRTVHYYRAGPRGTPPVVLLHGFTNNGLTWTPLARDLQQDYDLVALDAAGHGRSDGPGPDPAPDQLRDDVVAAITMLALERPALIGHSMGAGTAAAVAAQSGDRIRCAVLEDPGWRDADAPPARPGAVGSPEWLELIRTLPTLPPEERRALARRANPTWSEEDRALWVDARVQFDLRLLDGMRRRPAADWRDLARRIACPVLLVTADPDRGAIVAPAAAREAAGLLRAGQVVRIEGAGHNIRRDQYAAFRDAVLPFLKAH
ncbi:MAG TPA: alpha/beta hydrolase [Vicinamibacteria bacterium]